MRIKWYIVWLFLVVSIAAGATDAETYYRQGRELREANQPVAAMEAFIAATRVSSDEYSYKGRSFSNMATMCRMGERHALAYTLYEKSAEQFAKANDSLAYAYALNNMAWEQAVMGHKDTAMVLIKDALAACATEEVKEKIKESQIAAYLYAEEYDSVLTATQIYPMESAYFAILRAQAFTFLEQKDSAVFYAQQVLEMTDNPRYLDDVYYILVHCDSAANADAIRALASTRSDLQQTLERNNAEWIEAMLLAEKSLIPTKSPMKWGQLIVFTLLCLAVFALVAYLLLGLHKTAESAVDPLALNALEERCVLLRRSAQVRTDLQWYDYHLFSKACNTQLSGIVRKLEQRGLSEREIRICVLVLIGFSYAEMADILYRAENGIGKDKYMIAKHLGVRAKDLRNELQRIACDE